MRRTLLIAVVLACFVAGKSDAAPPPGERVVIEKGNELFDQCKGFTSKKVPAADAWRFTYCQGYISGVADTLSGLKAICPPRKVNSHQYVGVVVDYLTAHPKLRNSAAASLIIIALKEKFPCN